MPAVATRKDSLRDYLTGAGSGGGSQTDPNACFGNFRSSTEASSYGILISGTPITNLTIDYASGGNASGDGTLVLLDSDTIAWEDSEGTQGSGLFLAGIGSTGIVEASGNPGAYLRVTRTSNSAMTGGPSTITLTTLVNNLFGFDDVSSTLAESGETEYRASIVKNDSVGTVTNFFRWIATLGNQQVSDVVQLGASGSGSVTTTGSFVDWPDSGWCRISHSGGTLREIVYYSSRTNSTLTVPAAGRALLGSTASAGAVDDLLDAVPGIAIAIDTNGVQAADSAILIITNANTAPAGVTWNTGITKATGLSLGTMTTGQEVGIWIKRQIPVGAKSSPLALIQFNDSLDAA